MEDNAGERLSCKPSAANTPGNWRISCLVPKEGSAWYGTAPAIRVVYISSKIIGSLYRVISYQNHYLLVLSPNDLSTWTVVSLSPTVKGIFFLKDSAQIPSRKIL